MYSLAEEEAINVLTATSNELLRDMVGEYQEEIVQLMNIALSGKDSFDIGLKFNDIKDKIVARVSQMDSVWDKANQRLNEMRGNGE